MAMIKQRAKSEEKDNLQLEYDEIKKVLPHRYPFLLVDRIIEGKIGEYAIGIKQITGNEAFFQGHFPAEAIFPGVLQIEAMAQVGAVALLTKEENKGKIALFAGIKTARFKAPVKPGDSLVISTEFTGQKAGIGFAKAKAQPQLIQ